MKNLIKGLLGILLISILVISCKKDKDNDNNTPAVNNHLMVNDVRYNLSKGILENYGRDADPGDGWDHAGFNLDLSLFSAGLVVTNYGDTMFDVTGNGQVIYFEMFSDDSLFLENGEYNFSSTQPFPTGSFDYGDYSINLDVDNNTGDWIEIESGKVKITKSGSTYEITINCLDANGEAITGYYKGTLVYLDYTTNKKSKAVKKHRY